MKTFLLSICAAAILALPFTRCAAQEVDEVKPIAVLCIASYDRLMTDLAFIGDLTGSPDLDQNIEGMIQLFTQGQGLVGLDRKRPLGVAINTDGLGFQPLIVLPVTDLKQLLAAIEGLVGAAQDAGNGIFELDVFSQKIYVKESNTWAYLSTVPEPLAALPKNGGDLFAGLDQAYDIAGRLHVQNVPEVFRTMLIDQLRIGVEAGLARQPNETDEAYETRRKMVETQIDSLTTAINELDELTLGASVNPEAKTAQLELAFKALPGTETAKQLNQTKPSTSLFAGFAQADASASLNLTAELTDSDAAQYVAGLDAIRGQIQQQIDAGGQLADEASKKLAQEMMDEVFNAVKVTFQSGKIDAGATLNVSDKSMALVVGAYVADPKSLEAAIQKFAKLGQSDPNLPKVTLNAAEHAGIKFHTTVIDVPADQNIAKVVGNKLDVAVGLGEKTVYLAIGNDSLDLAKKLIDRSASETGVLLPPFQLNLAMEQILKFAAALQPAGAENNMQVMAEDLAQAPGKDHVRLEYVPAENGGALRVSAEAGVLKLLGAMLMNAQAEGGIPGFGL